MFAGQAAFDRHQRFVDGHQVCLDPEPMTVEKGARAGRAVYREDVKNGSVVWALNSGPSPWAKP